MKRLILAGALIAAPSAAQDPDPQLTDQVLERAAMQVKKCYRAPRVSHSGRQIVTTLRVRMTADGYPIGLPTIVAQHNVSGGNRAFASKMAQAAITAVLRCAPFQFPPELHEQGWSEIELTFSPVAAA